ncbi:uncharacterized protein LOC117326376 [Pecten maximus]|uniref:uncharacterized protein LOC117326376 n=1 Tax=Pecten maximus TaxID=6579 RepID=UPI00145856D6|nr:uncharacterized protein LOC117326376 [Pecten maximus]
MSGVGHLLANGSNPKEGNMKNALMLNKLMKEGSPRCNSSPPSMMGLVNGNNDTYGELKNVKSPRISEECPNSASTSRDITKSLLDNFKSGLSVSNDNKKMSIPRENGIVPQLKSSSAKIANGQPSDRDALSSSQSSKKLNSRKMKSLLNKESVKPKNSDGDMRQSLDTSENEFQDSDSDSEASFQESPSPSFWSTFEDTILKINDQTDTMTLQPRRNFKASDDFKDVMTGMFGNTEYGRAKSYTLLKQKINRLTNVSGLASRLFQSAAKDTNKEEEPEEENEEAKEAAKVNDMENIRSELKGAKRGWKLLRRNVNETALAENTKDSKLKWTMVSHHVTRMTDLDKARQDLYERYGIVPATQDDGSVQCKNVMWSKRAISLNLTHPGFYKMPSTSDDAKTKKRVQSAHVTSNKSRPLTTGKKVNSKTLRNRPASESRILR